MGVRDKLLAVVSSRAGPFANAVAVDTVAGGVVGDVVVTASGTVESVIAVGTGSRGALKAIPRHQARPSPMGDAFTCILTTWKDGMGISK